MQNKSQFQNLILQHNLQEMQKYTQQSTIIQPTLLLPIRQETLVSSPPTLPLFPQPANVGHSSPPVDQETGGLVLFANKVISDQDMLDRTTEEGENKEEPSPTFVIPFKKKLLRGAALLLSALLLLALYLVWHIATPTSASPTITQQSPGNVSNLQPTSSGSSASTSNTGTIQVYILGAVRHPGVYTLPADARVYQLVQAAGGTLPTANLVALNLAARLTDGEEIYVLSVGEIPPSSLTNASGLSATPTGTSTLTPGQLVNINTATETQMKQLLHVSSTTAQKIIA
ncbi:MAG TPA: SLBB domain-containing protein, partial [Ktedonobacteraceae bacterium]|nr:SLBB domain-containing protein [Ktedonobacteraceae bacterium]